VSSFYSKNLLSFAGQLPDIFSVLNVTQFHQISNKSVSCRKSVERLFNADLPKYVSTPIDTRIHALTDPGAGADIHVQI
jgi:hypothetical protein